MKNLILNLKREYFDEIKTTKHKHFGSDPVNVYAIKLEENEVKL